MRATLLSDCEADNVGFRCECDLLSAGAACWQLGLQAGARVQLSVLHQADQPPKLVIGNTELSSDKQFEFETEKVPPQQQALRHLKLLEPAYVTSSH